MATRPQHPLRLSAHPRTIGWVTVSLTVSHSPNCRPPPSTEFQAGHSVDLLLQNRRHGSGIHPRRLEQLTQIVPSEEFANVRVGGLVGYVDYEGLPR